MPEESPLSYQTTMPEYPDVSYEAYKQYLGGPKYMTIGGANAEFNRAGYAMYAHQHGYASYDNWRTNALDEYSNRMSAYNTWLSSGAGKRASALSGDYNPSYFDAANASASPAGFSPAPEDSGWAEMAQGIRGIFDFAQALQGLRLGSAQIMKETAEAKGAELKNQYQAIQNKFADALLKSKVNYTSLGADWLRMRNEAHLFSRFPDQQLGGMLFYGDNVYNLDKAGSSFEYQRNFADLQRIRQATALAAQSEQMLHWSAKEKEWYFNNMLELQKDLLNNQNLLLSGEVNFQPIEQKIRKSAAIANIGIGVANTLIGAIKAFTPSGALGGIPGLNGGFGQRGRSVPGYNAPLDPFDLSGYGTWSDN